MRHPPLLIMRGGEMNTVEPIREKELVIDIAEYLKSKNIRDYVLFMFGIYSGLRISDVLKFRVRDVKDKKVIAIREMKTGKEKQFPINRELQPILGHYVTGKADYEYLFPNPHKNKPITRQQAYNILSAAGRIYGIDRIGTHTLRKTFGYHIYQRTKDAAMLMDIFNHSDIHTTLRYIGVNQETKDKVYNTLSFKK